jgi:hypothetical protein
MLIMSLPTSNTLELLDARHQPLGQIVVARNDQGLFVGDFTPNERFSALQSLFRDYEEAVNVQALSVVDLLDTQIAQLDLQVALPDGLRAAITDVQIWSDGAITFRPASLDEVIPDALAFDHPVKH